MPSQLPMEHFPVKTLDLWLKKVLTHGYMDVNGRGASSYFEALVEVASVLSGQ